MGWFDRLVGKKSAAPLAPASSPAPEPAPVPVGREPVSGGGILPRLREAREKLEARDLAGATVLYEEILATAGDRSDVLVTISGDLGSCGFVESIVDLIAPRYDAERHGPATGLNLLQAYLATRNTTAAQHLLDILFGLGRPELDARLHGFSNALAELLEAERSNRGEGGPGGPGPALAIPKIDLVSISKPIWFYGLEANPTLLPTKSGRLRRIAFAQLALPDVPNLAAAMDRPEDELGRLSRAFPLWLADSFFFTANYAPLAVVGVLKQEGLPNRAALFPSEWTPQNLRQLVDTAEGGLDYVITGALRHQRGDYEVGLRVWEVRKFRERKQFIVRWTPATADRELAQLQAQFQAFMEWTPCPDAESPTAPASLRTWLDTLGASLALFLADKQVLPRDALTLPDILLSAAAQAASEHELAALAWLTLQDRAQRLDLTLPATAEAVASSSRVAAAQAALGLA